MGLSRTFIVLTLRRERDCCCSDPQAKGCGRSIQWFEPHRARSFRSQFRDLLSGDWLSACAAGSIYRQIVLVDYRPWFRRGNQHGPAELDRSRAEI